MDYNELRKIARTASPGPWTATGSTDGGGTPQAGVYTATGPLTWDDHGGDVFLPEDAVFIATFNPEMILDLLDRLEENQ